MPDQRGMNPTPTTNRDTITPPPSDTGAPEPKPARPADPLAAMAIDANALAGAIWSGQGTDVSKLIEDMLRSNRAA